MASVLHWRLFYLHVIGAGFGRMDLGIIISEGALCVSIGDAPGPVEHKRNGMLYSNVFVFLIALLTGLVNDNLFLLGLLVLFSSFFFSMFTVYGNRAASVGTAALLIMILRMAKVTTASETTDRKRFDIMRRPMVHAYGFITLQDNTLSPRAKITWRLHP